LLQWQKRQVIRGLLLNPRGLSATAAELSLWLTQNRTSFPVRTVERILARLKRQGFWSLAHTYIVRDASGRRIFRKERILRRLNLGVLLPVNVAVTERECGGDKSFPKNKNLREEKSWEQTGHDSQKTAPVSQRAHRRPTQEEPQEKLLRFKGETLSRCQDDSRGTLSIALDLILERCLHLEIVPATSRYLDRSLTNFFDSAVDVEALKRQLVRGAA